MNGRTPDSGPASLRILMTVDAVGGVWQYGLDLVSGLVREGAEVLLAILGPRPSARQQEAVALIPRCTVVESDYALEWMQDPWNAVEASGEWLLDLQSHFNPDVIHLNSYSSAALRWQKPVLVTAHSCVVSWWRAVHGCAPGTEWSEYRQRVTAGLQASAIVVAPSGCMAHAIVSEYGILGSKMRMIHNSSRMCEYAGKQKEPFLFAAGRIWDPAKNLSLLDRIAPNLDWPVRVAGSERGPERTASAVKSVHLLGTLSHDQMEQELHSASIFLHPALYEPFGLSVLEAARSRCCLVLSDIPSLRELWEGAATFLDPHDPERWTSVVNQLCRDFKRREDLSNAAFRHSQRYSWTRSTKEYLQAYRDLQDPGNGVAA